MRRHERTFPRHRRKGLFGFNFHLCHYHERRIHRYNPKVVVVAVTGAAGATAMVVPAVMDELSYPAMATAGDILVNGGFEKWKTLCMKASQTFQQPCKKD